MKRYTANIEDLRNQVGAFACGGRFQFYAHAFILHDDPADCGPEIVGAIFQWHLEKDAEGVERVIRKCVAGDNPAAPARAYVELLTHPTGEPSGWTFAKLAACDFRFTVPELELPAKPPEIVPATTYHHLATNPPCQLEPAAH
jgi:hypothetical protein